MPAASGFLPGTVLPTFSATGLVISELLQQHGLWAVSATELLEANERCIIGHYCHCCYYYYHHHHYYHYYYYYYYHHHHYYYYRYYRYYYYYYYSHKYRTLQNHCLNTTLSVSNHQLRTAASRNM